MHTDLTTAAALLLCFIWAGLSRIVRRNVHSDHLEYVMTGLALVGGGLSWEILTLAEDACLARGECNFGPMRLVLLIEFICLSKLLDYIDSLNLTCLDEPFLWWMLLSAHVPLVVELVRQSQNLWPFCFIVASVYMMAWYFLIH